MGLIYEIVLTLALTWLAWRHWVIKTHMRQATAVLQSAANYQDRLNAALASRIVKIESAARGPYVVDGSMTMDAMNDPQFSIPFSYKIDNRPSPLEILPLHTGTAFIPQETLDQGHTLSAYGAPYANNDPQFQCNQQVDPQPPLTK